MNKEFFDRIHLKSVESTNLHASALLSVKKLTRPCLITADYQTGGKGQGQNSWESGESLNLLFSLVLFPPKLKAADSFYLSKITALSIRETLAALIPAVRIKWPNDILIGSGKSAGILIENTLVNDLVLSSVIGAGINVNQKEFSIPGATSIFIETGREADREKVLAGCIDRFLYWYELLQEKDLNTIDLEYYKYLFGFQQWLPFSWSGVKFEGKIEGVENDGYLVLKTRDGKVLKFGFGEVDFLIFSD